MTSGSATLGQHLVDRAVITDEQLRWAEQEAARCGGVAAALLDAGLVSEQQVVEAAAERLGVPFVDLDELTLDGAADLLDAASAHRAGAVAVGQDGGTLMVAMRDPSDQAAVADIERHIRRPIRPALAVPAAIDRALQRVYGSVSPDPHADLDRLLRTLVAVGGSDLHLSVGAPPTVRVHGRLRPAEGTGPLDEAGCRALVLAAMTDAGREAFERDLELDATYVIPRTGRFRVNAFVQRGHVAGVLRHIPLEIPPFETLGFPASTAGLVAAPRGLVLVTGPTGSGKSTTLASLVDVVNRTRRCHIVTVEDPIEFIHVHRQSIVNQREVGRDTRSFAAALRHALRQDPDVILVGEMRDLETIATALTAAETGHLVLATLHTQGAAQAVDRMVDAFPPHQQPQIRAQLAGTLRGVVSQQLVPAQGGGRALAAEILISTPATRSLIRDGKTHQINSTMLSGSERGMQTMDQSLAALVRARRISVDVALEHCHDADELRQLLGTAPAPRPATPAGASRR